MTVLAYSLDRVSVVLVVEKANCLIRLACVNNGGGDPASASPSGFVENLRKVGTEKKATASGVGGAAHNGRGRARSRDIATIEMVIFDGEAV